MKHKKLIEIPPYYIDTLRVAIQIPICLASKISEIPPMDQKICPLAPLGLAGPSVPSVPKIPKKFHQIAQNKQEKIVKIYFFGKICPQDIFSSKFLFRQGRPGKALILCSGNAVPHL
jgi:hypothetical protein